MDDGYVYVVGQGRPGDPVKIGWSDKPEDRIRALQTGSPHKLHILDQHPGPQGMEYYLHDQFKEVRLEGEWFQIDDPIPQIRRAVLGWTGEIRKGPRAAYAFDGPHVSVGIRRGRDLASAAFGLTDGEFRVVVWYWFATEESQGAVMRTQAQIAEELGLSVRTVCAAIKTLREARLLIEAESVGRTKFYRCNPHLAFVGTGVVHRRAVKSCSPPEARAR